MLKLGSLLSSYLIHYSKLDQRLKQQLASSIGVQLLPKIITEHCVYSYSPSIDQEDTSLTSARKAEMMAQVMQINHILLYHQSVMSHSQKVRRCNVGKSISQVNEIQIRSLFHQSLNAYSRKNIELSIQHLSAMKDFIATDHQYCLILEDDACVSSHCDKPLAVRIASCVDSISHLGEGFFDVSDSLNFSPQVEDKNQACNFIEMGEGQTRCASSYIVTRKVAETIINDSSSLLLPIDWHLSYLLSANKIKTFWQIRPIFTQGSQTGVFTSNQLKRNLND